MIKIDLLTKCEDIRQYIRDEDYFNAEILAIELAINLKEHRGEKGDETNEV